jgi:hypothetical protein
MEEEPRISVSRAVARQLQQEEDLGCQYKGQENWGWTLNWNYRVVRSGWELEGGVILAHSEDCSGEWA